MARKKAEMIVKLTSVSSNGMLVGEVNARPGSEHYKHQSPNGLTFPEKDVYDIIFDLEGDSTGYKLHFPVRPDAPADAFWVGPPGVCPVAAAGNGNGAFAVQNVTKKQLKVDNINRYDEDFMYMLRFRSENNPNKWYYLDPVVENGGGGHPIHHFITVVVAIVLGVAALVAGLIMIT